MKLLKEEKGQGAAEYLLLFAGVIVIVIIALYLIINWMNTNNLGTAPNGQEFRQAVATNNTNI